MKSFVFRNVNVPAEIMELLCVDKITKTEFVLLMIVESYCRYKNNGKYQGCFVSNSYLGKILKLHPRRVSQLIHDLRHKKLIVSYQKTRKGNSCRYLETCWTRLKLAENKDKTQKCQNLETENFRNHNLVRGGTRRARRGGTRPARTIIDNTKVLSNKEDRTAPCGAESNFPLSSFNGKSKSKYCQRMCSWFHAEMMKARKIRFPMKTLQSWETHLCRFIPKLMESNQLTKKEAQRYFEEILKDHVKYLTADFQPELYAISTICNLKVRRHNGKEPFGCLEDAKRRRENNESKQKEESDKKNLIW